LRATLKIFLVYCGGLYSIFFIEDTKRVKILGAKMQINLLQKQVLKEEEELYIKGTVQ
jgi:hypothetical protein